MAGRYHRLARIARRLIVAVEIVAGLVAAGQLDEDLLQRGAGDLEIDDLDVSAVEFADEIRRDQPAVAGGDGELVAVEIDRLDAVVVGKQIGQRRRRRPEFDDDAVGTAIFQFGWCRDRPNLPGVEDGHLVAEPFGLLDVVGCQQDRFSLFVEVGDEVPEVPPELHVDTGRGFVENQEIGIGNECPRQQKAAFHPAGKPVEAGVAFVVDADLFEHLVGAVGGLVGRHAVVTGLVLQHLADREEAVDVELLWREADGVAGLSVVVLHVVAKDTGGAAGFPDESDENVDERRFARAVGAEQPEETPLGDGQRDAVEGCHVVVLLAEVFDIESRGVAHTRPSDVSREHRFTTPIGAVWRQRGSARLSAIEASIRGGQIRRLGVNAARFGWLDSRSIIAAL